MLLDQDQAGNRWVRVFPDELVEVPQGCFLVCSHLRLAGKLRHLSYFIISFG